MTTHSSGARDSVLLKQLHSVAAFKKPRLLRRFEQDALATSALKSSEHPDHLRHRCGFSREWGAPHVVAELLEGDELRAKLNDGAITPRKAVERSNSAGAGEHDSSPTGFLPRKPSELDP